MSDTQEKLKHLIANLVVDAQYEISNYEAGGCSYKEYSRRIEKVSNTAEQEVQALIESAKREALEEMRPANATIESMRLYSPRKHTYMGKEYPSCSICGFCPEAMNAYIDAQLKQSKESK